MQWQLISRRDFLKLSGVGAALTLLAVAAPSTVALAAAQAGQLKDVPRNRTLIMAGLGGEMPGGFTDVDNYNIWVPGFSRAGYSNVAAQPLFYYNMMKDEFINWNGESYQYNPDFTEVSVKIRNGVAWSDGTPFTSNDIAFTINTHLVTPELTLAGDLKKRVKSVTVVDDQNLTVALNDHDPQFVFDIFTFRADVGLHIMPEHVWKGQDAKTFKFYDPDKGWPIGTGAYKLAGATIQQKIWDLTRIGGLLKPASSHCRRSSG